MGFPNPSISAEAARKAIAGDAPPSNADRQALDDEELRELETVTYAKVAPQAAAAVPQTALPSTSIWRRFLDRFTRG
jgi:hypothetical protein